MKIRPKLIVTFSLIFVIAFVAFSYIAHTTIESALLRSGLSEEEASSALADIGSTILAATAIIGTVAVLVVFWVSIRIAKPITKLSTHLKSQDIGQKLKRFEMKRSPIDKDDEINDVIYTINSMTNRINELEVRKDEFLSMITHELKTPASTVVGFAKALQNPKIAGELNPTQAKAIETIKRNAARLETMVSDLLDSRKLDLQKMRFEYTYVDITDLMKHLENSHQNRMKEKKIQFINSTKEKISVTTDRNRLEQVLTNLILNSVDFVPKEGARIEIGAQTKSNDVLFHVKDNGIGIPSEKQKNLFKKFYQADTTITRRHGGTGLGLAICKGVTEALGGKIWVESEPNKGTAFYFTIPKVKERVEKKDNKVGEKGG